jgi:hypothetical protein
MNAEGPGRDERYAVNALLGDQLRGGEQWASNVPLVGAGGFDSIEIRPVVP